MPSHKATIYMGEPSALRAHFGLLGSPILIENVAPGMMAGGGQAALYAAIDCAKTDAHWRGLFVQVLDLAPAADLAAYLSRLVSCAGRDVSIATVRPELANLVPAEDVLVVGDGGHAVPIVLNYNWVPGGKPGDFWAKHGSAWVGGGE